MFVLNQRVSILNTSSLASRRFFIKRDDKIRINKSNIYHKDRISLKN